MAGPANILREIHRLRRHAKDLQSEIERVPRSLKAQQAKIAKQEELAKEAHDILKRAKIDSHEKEVLLKTAQQAVAKHEKQLSEATSKKEYDALRVEIAADKKKCTAIEDEILNCMAIVEEKNAQIPVAEQAVKKAKQELAQAEKSSETRLVGLKEQHSKAVAEISEIEKTLPPDIMPHYDRIVGARGEDALSAVQNKTCMACYTEITAQAFNNLNLSQFVACKSCGRVLYLPE